jgi:twinkle protein
MAEGNRVGYEVALVNLADALRFKGSGIITVTGIPGHGKTEMVDAILIDLARLHKQQSIIAGFEQSPEEHVIKLMRKMIGVDITCETYRDNEENLPAIRENYDFVTNYFKHIDVDKIGGSINDILKYAAEIVQEQRENGEDPRYLVIDPFNMLSIKGKFSGHEKIEEILRRITHFSHQMKILVFLVAHPVKMRVDEKTGQYQIPDFYSVKGSSAFFEMSYHGFVVYRNPDGTVLVKILKVKQNNLGTTGAEVLFYYDMLPGRYIPIDEEDNELPGDHRERNWLGKHKELKELKK